MTIANCSFRQFTSSGVSIQPASSATAVSITNSIASDNNGGGIESGDGNAGVAAVIRQTTMSNNGACGLFAGNNASVMMTDSIALNNSVARFAAKYSVTLRQSRLVATGSGYYGVHNYGAGPVVQSYGDNRIDGNGTIDVFRTMTTTATQ